MGIIELVLLSVGLAMDAFAVSLCKGLAVKKELFKTALLCGIWFGFFQALMPLIGYFLGVGFSSYAKKYDHWIAFLLLFAIGISMIRESGSDEEDGQNDSTGFKTMLLLAIATSIDALAVGITFVCIPVNIFQSVSDLYNLFFAVTVIGIITCFISFNGVKIGNVFGLKYKNKAGMVGGIILIVLGLKILIQHLISAI